MVQKPSRHKRKMLGIRIKPKEGLWISYQLRLKGITGRSFAAKFGVRESTASQVINGRRSSRRKKKPSARPWATPLLRL
jgi:transcriptional regulator with XRE-family HTH domain